MADISLKEYIDLRFVEIEKRVELAFRSAGEAIAKAEMANERRLLLLNEFRAQSADESKKYALSVVVDQSLNALSDRVRNNENTISGIQGRALAIAFIGTIVGGVAGALLAKTL